VSLEAGSTTSRLFPPHSDAQWVLILSGRQVHLYLVNLLKVLYSCDTGSMTPHNPPAPECQRRASWQFLSHAAATGADDLDTMLSTTRSL
jgi:hypothetical protein